MTRSSDAQLLSVALPQPQDWVVFTLAAGFTAHATADAPSARQWADMVELCGEGDGTIGTGGVTIATLPSQFWPATNKRLVCATFNSTTAMLFISTAGQLQVNTPISASNFSLDGVRYRIV